MAYIFKGLCNQLSTGMKLPSFVFNLSKNNQKIILDNIIFGDGSKKFADKYSKKYKENNFRIELQSFELINNLCFLSALFDYSYSFRYRPDKKTWKIITSSYNREKSVEYEKIEYNDYVYDIEVNDNHNFFDSAGFIGLSNTDSQYLNMKKEEVNGFTDLCQKRFEEIAIETNAVRQVQILEFEDFYGSMIFVAKKRYAGHLTWCKGVECSIIRAKGLEVVRTDISAKARELQTYLLENLLKENKDIEFYKEFIKELKKECLSGKLTIKDITITQSVSKPIKQYKNKGANIQVAEDIIANEEQFYIGMKIPYIVVKSKPKILAIHAEHYYDLEYHKWFKKTHQIMEQINNKGEVKETIMFENLDEELKYDVNYYFDNKLYPPLSGVLEVVFKDFNWDKFTLSYDQKYIRKISMYEKALHDLGKYKLVAVKIKEDKELEKEDIERFRKIYIKTHGAKCIKLVEKYEKQLKNYKKYISAVENINKDNDLRKIDKEYLGKIYLMNIKLHHEKELKLKERELKKLKNKNYKNDNGN